MSVKSDVVALLSSKKDEKLAAVAAEFDALIAQINELPEDADTVLLQQKVQELEAKMSEELAKEAKLQEKLDQIKALIDA